ncbi:MAG: hypothetical protein QOG64_771 [Acidimicrobiaceae bacterium]|nr:hypothetical protein [Acidimicrobiaceae bacterium]
MVPSSGPVQCGARLVASWWLGQDERVLNPATQYIDDRNLAARQRFWAASTREPDFDLFSWVLDVAGLDAGRSADVLDVGCGNGRYESALAARHRAGRLVAVDLSAGMLQPVQHGMRVQADAQALPFPAHAFDVVLAPHMLYHVANVEQAAHECRRVLRPGGLFVAVTNGKDNIRSYVDLIEAAVGTGWRMRRPADDNFSLENGRERLAAAFSSVQRVDCPTTSVVVADVNVLADYIASVADHYETDAGTRWSTVVERARELAAAEIRQTGALRWTTSVGAFVCR